MKEEKLTVLLNREGFIVCVKPAGVSSEEGTEASPGMPGLIARTLSLPDSSGVLPVHRLDQGTGGVMVYALSRACAAALSRLIADGRMDKTYLAVTEGCPDAPEGRWTDLMDWDRSRRKAYTVSRARKGVREAALRYETLGQKDGLCLLRIALETGRTHQIRLQCASRGLPVMGDRRYGGKRPCEGPALWCESLRFPDPEDGRRAVSALVPPPRERTPWRFFMDQGLFENGLSGHGVIEYGPL